MFRRVHLFVAAIFLIASQHHASAQWQWPGTGLGFEQKLEAPRYEETAGNTIAQCMGTDTNNSVLVGLFDTDPLLRKVKSRFY